MELRPLNPENTSVLVVEDDGNDALITVRELAAYGIKNIFHAATGEDSLEFLRSNHCACCRSCASSIPLPS